MDSDITRRLVRLEARQNRLRLALGLLLLAVGCALASRDVEAKPEGAPSLKVSELVLVDAQGRTRARLGVDKDGEASLMIVGVEAATKAVLTVSASGRPGLVLRNAEGKAQLIASLPESGASLILCDPAGEVASSLTFRNDDGTSLFGLRLPGEKAFRASLSVLKDGEPYLKLSGAKGNLRLWAKPEMEFTPKERD